MISVKKLIGGLLLLTTAKAINISSKDYDSNYEFWTIDEGENDSYNLAHSNL